MPVTAEASGCKASLSRVGNGQEASDEAQDEGPRRDDVPAVTSLEDFGRSPDGEPDMEAPTEVAPARRPPPLALITPAQWRGVPIPPMRWLATNRIPAGDVTILSGDGGGGKTTLALQLAVSVAADLGDWLGTTCETGPVIFFSGEEPENEIRRRLERVAKKRGLEADDIENLHFHFAEPDKCTLGGAPANTPIAPTPLFNSLRTAAKAIRPALIIVDSNAATLGGNYLDRVHARTFVSLFRPLARELAAPCCCSTTLTFRHDQRHRPGRQYGLAKRGPGAALSAIGRKRARRDIGPGARSHEVELRAPRRKAKTALGRWLLRARRQRLGAGAGRRLQCRRSDLSRLPGRYDVAGPPRLLLEGARLRPERLCRHAAGERDDVAGVRQGARAAVRGRTDRKRALWSAVEKYPARGPKAA